MLANSASAATRPPVQAGHATRSETINPDAPAEAAALHTAAAWSAPPPPLPHPEADRETAAASAAGSAGNRGSSTMRNDPQADRTGRGPLSGGGTLTHTGRPGAAPCSTSDAALHEAFSAHTSEGGPHNRPPPAPLPPPALPTPPPLPPQLKEHALLGGMSAASAARTSGASAPAAVDVQAASAALCCSGDATGSAAAK